MEIHGGSWVQCTWSRNWKHFWLLGSKFQVKLFSLEYHLWCYDSPYPVYASVNFVVLLDFHDYFAAWWHFTKKLDLLNVVIACGSCTAEISEKVAGKEFSLVSPFRDDLEILQLSGQ